MFIVLFVLCLISILIILWVSISENDPRTFCALLPIIVVGLCLLAFNDAPTAIDVYQNKTTLKYIVVDSVKIDSLVIWKKELNN